MTPQITESVREELQREATVAATAQCNERLERIDLAMQTLLNDWQALQNSPEMGAIKLFGQGGHVPAKVVVRGSSDLLTRAQALRRELTRARGGMADMEVDEETSDTPAAKRARIDCEAVATTGTARATNGAPHSASGDIEARDIRTFFTPRASSSGDE